MKKILVAFLSVMMLIAFTACDNDAKAYADYETSKALVDAISMQKLVGDFKSMLSGTPVTGLEPAIDVQNEEGDAEDKVVVTLTIAEGGYAVSNVENPVKITKGTATVTVYGTANKSGDTYESFTATGYSITTKDVELQNGDNKYAFSLDVARTAADVKISYAEGKFTIAGSTEEGNPTITIPLGKDVDCKLGDGIVEYERLCADNEPSYTPGDKLDLSALIK